jgi:dihydrofolate reductase
VAFGGIGFKSSLIASGLADELHFYTNPIALHQGHPIFAEKGINQDLQLIVSGPFSTSINYRQQRGA